MSLNSLFNIRVPIRSAMKDAEAAASAKMVGVISTKQSAVTFAGAPVFVMLMWKVLGAAIPSLAESKLCALVLSLAVGVAIYAVSEAPGETPKDKFAGYVYAFINSFAIAAAVLGIDSAVSLP